MVFPRHNHHEPFLQHVGTGKWMHMAIFTDNYINPIGSMVLLYGNIYHQYTPNVSIYTIHGSYGNYDQNGILGFPILRPSALVGTRPRSTHFFFACVNMTAWLRKHYMKRWIVNQKLTRFRVDKSLSKNSAVKWSQLFAVVCSYRWYRQLFNGRLTFNGSGLHWDRLMSPLRAGHHSPWAQRHSSTVQCWPR
jgi:hypothetical protein